MKKSLTALSITLAAVIILSGCSIIENNSIDTPTTHEQEHTSQSWEQTVTLSTDDLFFSKLGRKSETVSFTIPWYTKILMDHVGLDINQVTNSSRDYEVPGKLITLLDCPSWKNECNSLVKLSFIDLHAIKQLAFSTWWTDPKSLIHYFLYDTNITQTMDISYYFNDGWSHILTGSCEITQNDNGLYTSDPSPETVQNLQNMIKNNINLDISTPQFHCFASKEYDGWIWYQSWSDTLVWIEWWSTSHSSSDQPIEDIIASITKSITIK